MNLARAPSQQLALWKHLRNRLQIFQNAFIPDSTRRSLSLISSPVRSSGFSWRTTGSSSKCKSCSHTNYYYKCFQCRSGFSRCKMGSVRLKLAEIHTSPANFHGEFEWQDPKSEEEIVNVEFMDKEGKTHIIRGKIGDNLLYLAKRFEVEMEGACEASLACTTCHIYVNPEYLDLLPEATETEEDLLDQAPFLKPNSRLGCQIILNKQIEGIKLTLPAATKNFYVDGHKPTPH